jgi:hypothetical protein
VSHLLAHLERHGLGVGQMMGEHIVNVVQVTWFGTTQQGTQLFYQDFFR